MMNTIYKVTMGLLLAGMVIGGAGLAAAETVAIDMSSALNYDAFGEVGEDQYCTWFRTHNPTDGVVRASVVSTAMAAMGQPWLNYNIGLCESFISQDLAVSGTGAPMNYLVGNFEIGKGVTPPAGYSRYGMTNWTDPGPGNYPTGTNTATGPNLQYQTLLLWAESGSPKTGTVTLVSGQQVKCSSLNLLYNGWRNSNAGTYKTIIQALYSGDANYTTIWQDVSTTILNTKGGSLATMGAISAGNIEGTWEDADGVDANTFGTDGFQTVTPRLAWSATRIWNVSSTPNYSKVSDGARCMWTVDTDTGMAGNQGLALDPLKTLTAIRIITSGTSRYRLFVYGITAERAPSAAGTTISFQ